MTSTAAETETSSVARRNPHITVVDLCDSSDEEDFRDRIPASSNDDDVLLVLDDDRKPAADAPNPAAPRKRQRRNRNTQKADDDIQVVASKEVATLSPLYQVLEVFPDANVDHVQKILGELDNQVPQVLSEMAEKGYPKTKSTENNKSRRQESLLVHRETPSYKYDYMSSSSFTPSATYIEEARHVLYSQFPFLSMNGARKLLQEASNHFAICCDNIGKALRGTSSELDYYHDLERILQGKTKVTAEQRNRLSKSKTKICLEKARRTQPKHPPIQDETLREEVSFVREQQAQWKQRMNEQSQRQLAREISQQEGSAVPCSCCFEEVSMDEMVACRLEGHLFCLDCLQHYAESQVFSAGNLGVDPETKQANLELKCFHPTKCNSGFDEAYLRRALPPKVLTKYNELQFHATVERAGVADDMCACPKCGFKAVLAPSMMVFQCPVDECGFESCRKCHRESHIPLRCSEVEDKSKTDGRLRVEEAISAAKIRRCPKCKQQFIKESGCNKITCRCQALVCYICRKQVTGYDHFCQTPHCTHKDKSCTKCPLYSNAAEDDERAMREAGLKAAEQVHQESLASSEDPIEVRIDVEKILKRPAQPSTTSQASARRARRR